MIFNPGHVKKDMIFNLLHRKKAARSPGTALPNTKHNFQPIHLLIAHPEAVSKVFFNRRGAKTQRKLVLIMSYLHLLCTSAPLRF
jgi:hypothetical protein